LKTVFALEVGEYDHFPQAEAADAAKAWNKMPVKTKRQRLID